jgi:hypothetical protein
MGIVRREQADREGQRQQRDGDQMTKRTLPTPKQLPTRRRQPPKPTPSGPGRRRTPLRQHPDRYALARVDAMTWLCDSERKGAILATMNMIGVPGTFNADRLRLEFEFPAQVAADINDLSENLRNMCRWYWSDDDVKWRTRAAEAYLLAHAFSQSPDREARERAARLILRCVAEIDETEWANRTLIPRLGLNF